MFSSTHTHPILVEQSLIMTQSDFVRITLPLLQCILHFNTIVTAVLPLKAHGMAPSPCVSPWDSPHQPMGQPMGDPIISYFPCRKKLKLRQDIICSWVPTLTITIPTTYQPTFCQKTLMFLLYSRFIQLCLENKLQIGFITQLIVFIS